MRSYAGILCCCAALLCLAPAIAAAGDNPFPLGKKMVPETYRGELQAGSGISFAYSKMTDTVVISDFAVALGGQPLPAGTVVVDHADHDTSTYMARFDTWVLPFMNVYGFAATINGAAQNVPVKVNPFPGMPAVPIPSSITLDFNGHLYGIGTTFAGGYKKFLVTYDVNREWVTLNILSNETSAVAQSVRAGFWTHYNGNLVAVYAGGFHLRLGDGPLTGAGIFPAVPSASFSLKAQPTDPWNTIVGAKLGVSKQLTVTVEAGLGTRKQFTIMPGVRF
jgi:hypothetical protein